MIDLQAICDAYAFHGISNVCFNRGTNIPAHGLTKISKYHAFYHLLQTEKCDFIVKQWVIRSPNATVSTPSCLLYGLAMIAYAAQTIYTHRETLLLHTSAHVNMQLYKLYRWKKWNCFRSRIASCLYSFMIMLYFKKVRVRIQ